MVFLVFVGGLACSSASSSTLPTILRWPISLQVYKGDLVVVAGLALSRAVGCTSCNHSPTAAASSPRTCAGVADGIVVGTDTRCCRVELIEGQRRLLWVWFKIPAFQPKLERGRLGPTVVCRGAVLCGV